MVLVENQSVKLIELTVPHSSQESMRKAKVLKSSNENYQKVLSDFDVSAELYTIEIGSLDHWLPSSRTALLKAFPSLKKSATSILDPAGKKVVGASQIIFYARTELSWLSSRSLFIPVRKYSFFLYPAPKQSTYIILLFCVYM